MRENEGRAARILLDFDADAEKIRSAVAGMLGRELPTSHEGLPRPPTVDSHLTFSVSSTHEGDRRDRFVRWLSENAPLLAGVLMFGVGIFVGWLIWD